MIRKYSDEILEYAIEIRRHLHMNPELSKQEYNTKAYIIEKLKELDVEYQEIANTGVMAIIPGNQNVLALRADIDALPIKEDAAYEYASLNEGVSHACGHDGHTAIALATIKVLKNHPELLSSTLKVIFQHDEEQDGGSQDFVKAGCIDDVSAMFGLHLQPYLQVGQVEYIHGAMNASSTTLKIIVEGKSAHAAYPQEGIDSIYVMSNLITSIQSITSRVISPLDNAVISFGTINGGQVHNQIADHVEINGTMRIFDKKVGKKIKTALTNLCQGHSLATGAKITISMEDSYPPLINSSISFKVEEMLKSTYKKENIFLKKLPSLGVEDFGYYLEKTEGVFVHIGSSSTKEYIPLHSKNFDFDEKCLSEGVFYFLNCLTKFDE